MYLSNIKYNKNYIIKLVNINETNKRRLCDIGLNVGTKVKLLFISPSKKIKAYLIRNSIIAIRNSDASRIKVSELND